MKKAKVMLWNFLVQKKFNKQEKTMKYAKSGIFLEEKVIFREDLAIEL